MHENHQRIYKASKEDEREFYHLCKLRRKKKIYFKFDRSRISEYPDLLFEVYYILYKKKVMEKVYSDKTLAFFIMMNEEILFFEKNAKVMKSIFTRAFAYYKKHKRGFRNYSYDFIDYFEKFREVKLRDLTHFTIDLSKIFQIESDWEKFPENLSKHPLQIRKSIYKSLKESMVDRIDYYYSQSNYFFGKWKKRQIEFIASENGLPPIYRVATVGVIYNILYHVSSSNNCSVSNTVIALDNVLESIYQKKKRTLTKMSPINLWFALENLGEGDSIAAMEKFITESLFRKREDF